jgi:hypothetical protein
MLRLLVAANVVPSSLILVTLMMAVIRPSETSVLTRSTRRHIPDDGILHSHRRENLKSYIRSPSFCKCFHPQLQTFLPDVLETFLPFKVTTEFLSLLDNGPISAAICKAPEM